MEDKLIINGITYVRETTEPVKRERRKFYISIDDHTMCYELFDGEIIISREHFENVANDIILRNFNIDTTTVILLRDELFK